MTCIVGVATRGEGVVLGADTLAGNSDSWIQVASPKLYKPRPWLAFGFTTSWRFGQILGHELDLPAADEPVRGEDVLDWVVRTLVPAMRSALKEAGFATREERTRRGRVSGHRSGRPRVPTQ